MIVVKAKNGAANATQQNAKDNGDKNGQTNIVFSEAGTYKIDEPVKQIQEAVQEVKVSDSLVKLLTESKSNDTKLAVKHRGVTKVGISPVAEESHETKSSTINSDKSLLQSNITKTGANETKSSSAAISPSNSESKPAQPLATSSSTTSMTSTTSTTTTTTTTPKPTTTQAPKKPSITYSVEDVPGLMSKAAEAQPQTPAKESTIEEIRDNEPLSLQSSETITYPDQRSSHNYIMSIVGVLVIVPLLVLVTNCTVKRARDYWSKRRYRRMDYLIEDMYN